MQLNNRLIDFVASAVLGQIKLKKKAILISSQKKGGGNGQSPIPFGYNAVKFLNTCALLLLRNYVGLRFKMVFV